MAWSALDTEIPLEAMAYEAEAAFAVNEVFDAEKLVARKLN
jgi:hypothetical protein